MRSCMRNDSHGLWVSRAQGCLTDRHITAVGFPWTGLFDAEKEVERLKKQSAKIEKELAGLSARLLNKKFTDKAPPEVVAEVRQQHAEAEEQLAMVAQKLTQLAGL
jgi:valyl-tRNA synthetase